jgi:hypothetical protein
MNRTLLSVGIALCFGCATKSLPPGTPPPEYETRSIEPWPPSAPDAGTDDASPGPAMPAPAETPVDGDAGIPPSGDAGAS